MTSDVTRRQLVRTASAAALLRTPIAAAETPPMRNEASDIPKICLELSAGRLAGAIPAISSPSHISETTIDDAGLRRVKQLGVNYVLGGGPRIPWQETDLRGRMDRLKASGLTLVNLMIAGFPNTLYGRTGRDEEIDKVREPIRAAGRVGLPIVEYNFYAHRIVEGYYEKAGRAGSGLTAFDYDKIKDLVVSENWSRLFCWLKARRIQHAVAYLVGAEFNLSPPPTLFEWRDGLDRQPQTRTEAGTPH